MLTARAKRYRTCEAWAHYWKQYLTKKQYNDLISACVRGQVEREAVAIFKKVYHEVEAAQSNNQEDK